MEPFDSKFRVNPFQFASTFPLTAANHALANYKLKEGTGLPKFQLHQVSGEDRVAFAEIVRNHAIKNDHVFRITKTQTQAHQFAVFWLPYEAGHTTRCTLRLSKTNPTTDSGGIVTYPDYFVTIGLSGCTISVVGDPHEPTVYHSGQENLSPGPGDPEADDLPGRSAVTRRRIVDIVTRSESRFPKHDAYHPNLKHLAPDQYAESLIYPERLNPVEENIRKEKYFIKDRVGLAEGATVIGSRSVENGTWQFYCQEWLHIIFERKVGFDCNEKIVRRTYKFWPGADEVQPGTIHVFPK